MHSFFKCKTIWPPCDKQGLVEQCMLGLSQVLFCWTELRHFETKQYRNKFLI